MFEDVMFITDKDTGLVVFHCAYREWPRMIPTNPMLSVNRTVVNLNKNKDYKKYANNFQLVFSEGELIYQDVNNLDEETLSKYIFNKEQCNVCWRWLCNMHRRLRYYEGYLPGVPIGKQGTNERKLFIEEQIRYKELMANEISENYHLIWLASNTEELELISEKILIRYMG
jgi:hypothetical protein